MCPLYSNLRSEDCFIQPLFDLTCVMFVPVETTTPAETATPTLPVGIETTTVPVMTTGEKK